LNLVAPFIGQRIRRASTYLHRRHSMSRDGRQDVIRFTVHCHGATGKIMEQIADYE
jgi:hypothetical protein